MTFLEYDNLFIISGSEVINPVIKIFAPERSQLGDYSCKVIMRGFGQEMSKEVFGISKPQALSIAIRLVKYLILNSSEYEEGRIYSKFADGSVELMFPGVLGGIEEEWK